MFYLAGEGDLAAVLRLPDSSWWPPAYAIQVRTKKSTGPLSLSAPFCLDSIFLRFFYFVSFFLDLLSSSSFKVIFFSRTADSADLGFWLNFFFQILFWKGGRTGNVAVYGQC